MRRMTAVLLLTLLVGAGACGSEGEPVETDPTGPPTTDSSPTSTNGTSTTAAPTTSAPPTTAEPPIETGIVLADDGLVIIPFGSNAQIVRDALDPDLGDPEDQAAECPSGADQILVYENLRLVLSGGFFVGYVYDSPRGNELGVSLATEDDLVLSATESELRALYPAVEIDESSLGTEFTIETDRGYLGGLLSEPGGVVTTIWAGDTCAFR